MTGIWNAIFRPKDGSRRRVAAEVTASREKLETASNRLDRTIQEFLDRNDSVTGRAKNAKLYPPR